MDDSHFRQHLNDFHRQAAEQQKFTSFKSFIVSSQLSDFSHEQSTNEKRDSLAGFREVFDHFFAPKKFVGYRCHGAAGKGQVVVDSPFGGHDTDSLSDGEKEVLHILSHLFRLRELSNIVLWDTPELHLNAALESRLYSAIRSIAPKNQYWIATHSLELINAVPLESIFVLRQDGTSAIVERASGEARKAQIAIYRDMGVQVGLQLVSSIVVFVEGKDTSSDKRILDQLVAPGIPGINFVPGDSCENIFAIGTRANRLLETACANGDFFAVVDRDYRDDCDVADLIRKYHGRLFVWDSHEIENVFLHPDILRQTLVFLGHIKGDQTPESLKAELKAVVVELKDWIAADWVASEFERSIQPPSRHISGDKPKESLEKYASNLKQKITKATETANLDTRYEEKRTQIQRFIDQDQWLRRLPGKQILRRYLKRFPTLTSENYMCAAASIVQERKIVVPELERLKTTLQRIPGSAPK